MEGKSTDEMQTKIKSDLPTASRLVALLPVPRELPLHPGERGSSTSTACICTTWPVVPRPRRARDRRGEEGASATRENVCYVVIGSAAMRRLAGVLLTLAGCNSLDRQKRPHGLARLRQGVRDTYATARRAQSALPAPRACPLSRQCSEAPCGAHSWYWRVEAPAAAAQPCAAHAHPENSRRRRRRADPETGPPGLKLGGKSINLTGLWFGASMTIWVIALYPLVLTCAITNPL